MTDNQDVLSELEKDLKELGEDFFGVQASATNGHVVEAVEKAAHDVNQDLPVLVHSAHDIDEAIETLVEEAREDPCEVFEIAEKAGFSEALWAVFKSPGWDTLGKLCTAISAMLWRAPPEAPVVGVAIEATVSTPDPVGNEQQQALVVPAEPEVQN